MTAPNGALMAVRVALIGGVAACAWLDARRGGDGDLSRRIVAGWCVLMIAFVVALWCNHVPFPLHLDLMEGTIFQHVERAAHGQPVYPPPAPGFVALAYDPLYYYLCVPFTWVFGLSLPTIRLVAILGMAVAGLAIYVAVRDRTESSWWGLVAVGLYAAAYRVMDAYLDTAHGDSWMLATAVGGTTILARARTRRGRVLGVAILVLAFWFKQHGALFAIGGLAYLTWRERGAAWPYWLVAIVLGPVAYFAAASWPFGSAFHFFTWDVPRGWSAIRIGALARVLRFGAHYYAPLLLGAAVPFVRLARGREPLSVWHVQFLVGVATAFMGALDLGSSENVFIPFGAMTIVLGTMGLAEWGQGVRRHWAPVAAAVAFAPLLYPPAEVLVAPGAPAAYADLVRTIRGLDAPVYAPGIGMLADTSLLWPRAHWVALEDLWRGPGHTPADSAAARLPLGPALYPAAQAFVLTNVPLDQLTAPVSTLQDRYVLMTDFGTRFEALRGLPRRYDHKYPRYLYAYRGGATRGR